MRGVFKATCFVGATICLATIAETPAASAISCAANGLCSYYIPQDKLPQIDAQQTLVWCWAASAQAIFRYYGYEVSQADIVAVAYGGVIPANGTPDAMLRVLNHTYNLADGRSFTVRTPRYIDSLGLMPGGIVAFGAQPGLTNAEVFNELGSEHPVFYADGPHAMVLVAGTGFGANPMSGIVLDPFPVGGQLFPGARAIGLRNLTRGEMQGLFMAKVVVTPSNLASQ